MSGCKARSALVRKLTEVEEKHADDVTMLNAEEHSKYCAGVGKL